MTRPEGVASARPSGAILTTTSIKWGILCDTKVVVLIVVTAILFVILCDHYHGV